MHRNSRIIAAGAAAALAVAGTGAGVAIAASSAKSHTLQFKSEQTWTKNWGYKFADSDKDVKGGKRIGADVVYGTYHPKSQSITVSFAATLKGGIIYGAGSGTETTFTGKVTGGTGKFKGATGTITGTSFGKQNQNENLKIVYTK